MKRALLRYGGPALLLEGALLGLVALPDPFTPFAAFLALVTLAFAAFVAGAVLAWRDASGGRAAGIVIFVAGAAFRATLLPLGHSDDLHRYIWEGRMQLAGWNPFAHAPESPELAPLRDGVIYPRLNGKQYTTIYPPLAQLVFAATARISGTALAFKIVFTGFDLLTGVFLWLVLRRRRAPPARVLLYLWCPQLLLSVAGRGHVDPVQGCLILLALWLFLTGRTRSGALALGLAVMAKTLAVVLVPAFFLHAERRRDLWPAALPLLLYLPYAGAGAGLVESLIMFGLHWSTNPSLHPLLTGGGAWPGVALAAAAATYAVALLRARRMEHAVFAGWAVFLVFSPTVHPWYLVGLIPFLALRWRPAWLLLSYTLFFYYSFFLRGTWHPIAWMPVLEYTPFYLLLAVTAWRRLRPRRESDP